jgi:biotin carboxyl carrier protein
MKYLARFPGAPEGVALDVAAGAPSFDIAVNGTRVTGNALRLAPGVWSIVREDGRQVEVRVVRAADGSVRVKAGAAEWSFELLDELTARALAATGGRSAKRVDHLAAAMPGRVLKVLVAPGDAVTLGQPLVVLEAMKMENEVKSPRDGTVASVDCAPGRAVSQGDVLIRFRPES